MEFQLPGHVSPLSDQGSALAAADRAAEADEPDTASAITRRLVVVASTLLGVASIAELLLGERQPLDLLLVLLVGAVGGAMLVHRRTTRHEEAGRRSEVETFARILQALSRSISPDALVSAIVEELGAATGADHVVFVRLRPNTRVLDATLVTTRPGVPTTAIVLPASILDDAPIAVGSWSGLRAGQQVRARVGPSVSPGAGAGSGPAGPEGSVVGGIVAVAAGRVPGRSAGRAQTAAAGGSARTAAGAGQRQEQRPERLAEQGGRPRDDGRPREGSGESAATRAATRIAGRVRGLYGLRNTLEAPLLVDGSVIGAIVLSHRTSGSWSPAAGRLLAGAAREAAAALERIYSLQDAEARAATDGLTGLPNRRAFDERCAQLARRRRADAIGILMVDIDHFKQLNDRHGHATGDAVLRAVASAIASSIRQDDVPARYGGEEFVVLLRDPTWDRAIEVGERVRTAVRDLDLDRLGVDGVTVSVGVAVGDSPETPIEEVLERADLSLYAAKRAGRDRVVAD